jgi:hypothetical protein
MWVGTPEFCKQIPETKSERVVFTLTAGGYDERDQILIDTLKSCYEEMYFWPQGMNDFDYLQKYKNIEDLRILPATKNAYDDFLTQNDTDYVGTRLHGGVYAMRHKRRSIIIAIDERAREINKANNLICIEKSEIKSHLAMLINTGFPTKIDMDFDAINRWKAQFM